MEVNVCVDQIQNSYNRLELCDFPVNS